jgi:hypothetical protein
MFYEWTMSEVLPAIRKTGTYSLPEAIRPVQKQVAEPLEYAKFLNAEYKEREEMAAANNDQREVDYWTSMIKTNLKRTHNIYQGKADEPMMIEDAESNKKPKNNCELLTVSEIMGLMGAPYNSYASMKQKSKVGKLVASRFRAESPGQEIEQTMKTMDTGHRGPVNAYRNRAWVEGVVRQFFAE